MDNEEYSLQEESQLLSQLSTKVGTSNLNISQMNIK